ncbi:ADP-ribosylation/Crystallin J1 [Alicyclobacillus acidocaldarius subsp. acidocaldarius Tc-4-1]|uniref:ADP-ribosylation/Crystallin J1 n=2 Tax=Alicyclobacillus acidocaldarius TaxID=405212 RepID=F8IHP2_ALIAT|nr:ADP-ribosylation/Crystallin J1 [Alicyclobacillus acidocaldarius subsp. acidocaldarius Tc-4-1]
MEINAGLSPFGGGWMIALEDRLRGGMWGLLVGDAFGEPYVGLQPEEMPPEGEIDMQGPPGEWVAVVPPGTWTDDGAQALCLLDSLLTCGRFDPADFATRLIAWHDEGLWTVDGQVFGIGWQTKLAIQEMKRGVEPERAGLVLPEGKGNGALMRVLPLALWHRGADAALVEDAHRQARVTHGHVTNQVCCAVYCLWARRMLDGQAPDEAYENAIAALRGLYGEESPYRRSLEDELCPDDPPVTNGDGYVVHTLNAARLALNETSYERVVRRAIQLGRDTDTNAAVAGGLAGIAFGASGIPERWRRQLRGRDKAEPLVESLVRWRLGS